MTDENNERAEYIAGMRQLMDILEKHPEIELPVDGSRLPLSFHFWGREARAQMAAVARSLPCQFAKDVSEGSSEYPAYFHLEGHLRGLQIKASAFRDAVCERVVTGTEEVTRTVKDPEALAAVPEVEVTETVETVEWNCGSLLAPESAVTA